MEKEEATHILVKKYANRRLYDTVHSQYVNLKQISDLIKQGSTVEVIDSATGEDISKVILTQIILEEEKEQRNLLPTEFLHQIIQYGESAYRDFFERFLTTGLAAYKSAQEQMESALRNWFMPWMERPGAPSTQEVEALKAKIAELETLLEGGKPPPRDAD